MTASAELIAPDLALTALRDAARLNREDPLRRGCLLEFPDFGQVVMTGDLHGHRANFAKLKRYAALDRTHIRHVILHELIHEEVAAGRTDRSHQLLIEAAQYKCEFPEQVHFLQSNHELAQLTGQYISKGGRDVVEGFARAVIGAYDGRGRAGAGRNAARGEGVSDGEAIMDAIVEFIDSLPLAARTPNRMWLSHSLPNERDLRTFNADVVRNDSLSRSEREDGGSAYQLVWGRHHTPRLLDELAARWDVDLFIIGHQPQEMGFEVVHDRIIILASDHNHGAFLPFDLGKPQTIDSLRANVRKFVEVA